jgi:glycosyltransferase involved in cell wall biosynthesis
MAERAFAKARTIVYDFDDAVHLRAPNRFGWPMKLVEDSGQITRLMTRADCVLAGNTWLAAAAASVNARRIEVLPTVVDSDRFTPARAAAGTELRIGWIGSPSTTRNLELVSGVVSTLHSAEVTLMGAAVPTPIAGTAVVPWCFDEEVAFVQSLDIGIMPLVNDEWNRGKCALKALQYMACGVPCVATPCGAVVHIIEHGVNGLFADSDAEWCAAFERLRDPAERARLGAAGRATVEAAYNLRAVAPRMASILESVAA